MVEYRFGAGVDGIDVALVAAVYEVAHHGVADLALFGGCPDDRHGIRLHDAPHGVEDGVVIRPVARFGGGTELHVVVHGEGPAGACQHGIQVQFHDFGEVGD